MLKKKLKKIKIAIFISDVGFGHMVRQRALIHKLLKFYPKVQITIYNNNNIEILKEIFRNKINYKKYFNNIEVFKTKKGFLNLHKTKQILKKWCLNCERILNLKNQLKNYDLILSDFVPEAFFLAKELKIKSFGICHFTWSWFFEKIGVKNSSYLSNLKKLELMSDKIFFPPYTPSQIFKSIPKTKIKKINFIIEKQIKSRKENKKKIFLIMDNGTETLSKFISRSLKYLASSKNFIFYIGISSLDEKSKNYISNHANLIPISGIKGIYNEIQKVDYVIARAGFNTITECLLWKKPAIFLNEKYNPEIQENIKNIYQEGLCAKMSSNDGGKKLLFRLNKFVKYESSIIQRKLNLKIFYGNGVDQIIKYIRRVIK